MIPLERRNPQLLCAVAALLLITAFPRRESAASMSDNEELWAGHQVVFGETDVPVLGKRETRSDSYVLATVRRTEKGLTMRQQACRVEFKEVLGTKVKIQEKALLGLPAAIFSFVPKGAVFKAAPWEVGWGRTDVDGDGKPGLTVEVDASICGGKLYVESTTKSTAFGKLLEDGDGMMGKIRVRVRQRIIDADSVCLKMFASDSEEIQTGGFVYRKVPNTATCASLLEHPWPILAKVKR